MSSQVWEDDATELLAPLDHGAFLLERYRIERGLSGGASGEVYLASDTRRGGLPVAIKVMRLRGATQEARVRFQREGAVLATLDHPGVVRVLDAGVTTDGRPFLVMERLDGETLEERLAREKTLPIGDVLRLVAFAADAIDGVHELGVLHRDLSPANVFLPASGAPPVKLIDFGFSHIAAEQRLTATNTSIGTPRYVAPEQLVSVKSAGAAADVYSLAVCAYEMLAGASPFETEDRGQLLGAVLHGRFLPLHERRPEMPAGLSQVLARGMATAPADRFATASELAGALFVAARVTPPRDLPQRVVRGLSPGAASLAPPAVSRSTPAYLAPPDPRGSSPGSRPSPSPAMPVVATPRPAAAAPRRSIATLAVMAVALVGLVLLVCAVGGYLARKFLGVPI